MKARHILLPLAITAAVTVTLTTPANAASLVPSGERSFAQSTLEPAYDAAHAGVITYLLTPNKAPNPVKSNPRVVGAHLRAGVPGRQYGDERVQLRTHAGRELPEPR